jgi:hypothetical protein
MSGAAPLLPLYVVILFVIHNFVTIAKDIDLDVFCDVFVRLSIAFTCVTFFLVRFDMRPASLSGCLGNPYRLLCLMCQEAEASKTRYRKFVSRLVHLATLSRLAGRGD